MNCLHSRSIRAGASYLTCCLLALTLLLQAATPARAQAPAPAPTGQPAHARPVAQTSDGALLTLGENVTRELKGGEAHSYRVSLKRGEFLRAVVEQKSVDIVVSLYGPAEEKLLTVDLLNYLGPEPVSFETETAGVYRLELRARGAATSAGRYELTSEVKTAAATDRARLVAERLLVEATAQERAGAKESFAQALEKYMTAAGQWRGLGDRFWEAYALHSSGRVSYILGARQQALVYWNQALALRRAVGDRAGEALTLGNMGIAYTQLGEPQKALEFYNRSLPIARAIGNRAGEADTLNNIGALYNMLGEQQKALEFYTRSLPLTRSLGNRASEANTLNNMGTVYSDLGARQKALEFYSLSLPLWRAIGNQAGEARTLGNVGWIYAGLGERQKALEFYNQSLPLWRAVGDRAGEAVMLNNIGKVYGATPGGQQKALEFYNQSLSLARAVGDRAGEAETLNNIGKVYATRGERPKAVEFYNQSLLLWRAVGDRAGEADTLGNLMSLWRAQDKPALAIFYGKRAVNAYQQLRSNIQGLDKEIQQTYLKTVAGYYRRLADLLITNNQLPEAQQVLGMLKEEEYFDFVRRDGAATGSLTTRAALSPKEAALEAEYNKLADEVALLGLRRGELLARQARTAAEEQQLNKLEDQLATATDHFQKFLEQLQVQLGPNTAQGARVDEVKDALGMQKTLRDLGDGAVLLYTLVGADKYHVMLVTPDTEQAYENPIQGVDLARKVLAFREALQNPRSDPAPLARELYQILVGPKLARDLKQAGAKTLMWSLDGVLRYLPVAALQDGQQKYLVETYRNVIFTPASRDRLKDPVAAHWQGLGLGVSKGKDVTLADSTRQLTFNPLPGVPQELRSIIHDKTAARSTANGDGILEGRVMLDESFTKDALRTALRQQYSLVHIASHFMFQPGNETDSFLLLGGMDEQNNKLTIAELKRLSFEGVNLLTLSACETALGGEKANGVEVESFGVLAQRQGAGAVMATLWPVADVSTPLLMKEFYRLRETNAGMTKAEALRRAQVALLTGDIKPAANGNASRGLMTADGAATKSSFAHPFYWAPFILIGNWK
jgi:CHAT domain-containing protein